MITKIMALLCIIHRESRKAREAKSPPRKMSAKLGFFSVLLALFASTIVIWGCQVTRVPGGFQVIPAPDEDPTLGGHYVETDINGRCYLSNGTWCIPCRGGVAMRCSDVIIITSQHDERSEQDQRALERRFYQLTSGNSGESFSAKSGIADWHSGLTVNLPLLVDEYDDSDDYLDVTFLWRSDWKQGWADVPAGVQVQIYVEGNFEDALPDMMAVRVSGDASLIQTFLSGFGTNVRVRLENGWSMN